ncbi:MAG: hypothetical protein A3H28_16125 [Acidobacteria bacterium RIFCSPLOWO2_02_FULL_61_28]|nr:MAG: hypothetical protein A3H28_16125 [Acidobacteria bacterium RIFCSPLOWO2_02_FULL_61_28]
MNFLTAYSYNKSLPGKVKLDFRRRQDRAGFAFGGTEIHAARRGPADLAPHPPEGPSGNGTLELLAP